MERILLRRLQHPREGEGRPVRLYLTFRFGMEAKDSMSCIPDRPSEPITRHLLGRHLEKSAPILCWAPELVGLEVFPTAGRGFLTALQHLTPVSRYRLYHASSYFVFSTPIDITWYQIPKSLPLFGTGPLSPGLLAPLHFLFANPTSSLPIAQAATKTVIMLANTMKGFRMASKSDVS